MTAAAACGLVAAGLAYTLSPGVDHTPGALLVTVSTALLVGAGLFLALNSQRGGWARPTLLALAALDVVGTAAAAYFLQTWVVLAAMAVAGAAWLAVAFGPAGSEPRGAA